MAGPVGTPDRAAASVAVDDAALVRRAREDREAFGLLYDRYLDAVFKYCWRRLGDREAAEDATGQTFARALAALPRYREEDAFRSWLFAIAHNVLVDGWRGRRPEAGLGLELAAGLRDPGPGPEEALLAAEADRGVRALLAGLTPDGRAVLELRLAGLADAEIARVLGRSHGAVRVAQHRALARLRAALGVPAAPAGASGKGVRDGGR